MSLTPSLSEGSSEPLIENISHPMFTLSEKIDIENSEKQKSKTESILENDLTITESDNPKEIISDNYLYVTAFTGLSLREYANIQSEKLAVMPYGTKVKVIIAEENPTMIIDNNIINHIIVFFLTTNILILYPSLFKTLTSIYICLNSRFNTLTQIIHGKFKSLQMFLNFSWII